MGSAKNSRSYGATHGSMGFKLQPANKKLIKKIMIVRVFMIIQILVF